MPSILIEVKRSYTQEQEVAIMDAVHHAMVEAFKIKPTDRHVRLIAHEPHRFACPSNRETPEYSTLISIDCLAGRSLDAKRNLYKAIVNNLEAVGIPKDHTKILLREIELHNWGLYGGQAGCDIYLCFKIDV
jgi:phenylpyruvate tautomerase PptA (4-oxalocrotonate tautomerase family)